MIIKCPECGHQVSDKAPVCPSCGVEIAGHITKCSHCGEIYLKEDIICPNCHCTEESHNEAPKVEETPKDRQTEAVKTTDYHESTTVATGQIVDFIIEETPTPQPTENIEVEKDTEPFPTPPPTAPQQVIAEEAPTTQEVVAEPLVAQPLTQDPTPTETDKEKKNNHLPLLVSVLLALLTAALFVFLYNKKSNTSNEAEAYETAMSSNDIEVMNTYLNDHSNAPIAHLRAVKAQVQKLKQENADWEEVLKANNITTYESYLAGHPKTVHKAEIVKRIDELAWAEATRLDNEASYLGYKEKYPNGVHNKEADEKLKVLLDNTSSPDEQRVAESLVRDFLRGINTKSTEKIAAVVATQFSFLGASGATTKDVATYMRERLYQADVKSVNWHLGSTTAATTDKMDDGSVMQTIKIPAQLVIEREGGKSSKRFAIQAKVQDKRIVSINWVQQAAPAKPTETE